MDNIFTELSDKTEFFGGDFNPVWRRERLPTPVVWPGEFYGLYGPRGRKQLEMTEWLSPVLLFLN